MSMSITITVPIYGQPNYLHSCLHALLKNSIFRHRIIVIWSDPTHVRMEDMFGTAADFEIDIDRNMGVQTYNSMQDFINRHRVWLNDNHIEFVDVTDRSRAFYDKLVQDSAGRALDRDRFVYPVYRDLQGGVDIAFKNNVGLEMTTSEWTIPNWDADFYAGPGWDRPLLEYAQTINANTKEMLLPSHVQPQYLPGREAAWDAWVDSNSISCHRLTIPSSRQTRDLTATYVTDEDFTRFCERYRRPGGIIRESCGERKRLHWVPALLRTQHVIDIGGYCYKGSGYDLEFDDRLRDKGGFTKVGFQDAFVLHKGLVPYTGCEPGKIK